MKYVDQYLRLEERATGAESRADEYRARAEENRWEQCRIVYEAVESGEYSRTAFARAVDKGSRAIDHQFNIWQAWGSHGARKRPRYADAYAQVRGDASSSDRYERNATEAARRVLADPKQARQVLEDPQIRRALMGNDKIRAGLSRTAREIDAQVAAKVDRRMRERHPGSVEMGEYLDAMGRVLHARQDVNKALDLLRGLPPMDADQRDQMRQIVGWLSTSIEWLHETLKARRNASLGDEIEAYLAEQGAS